MADFFTSSSFSPLWVAPALPLLAALGISFVPGACKRVASGLAILALLGSLGIAVAGLVTVLHPAVDGGVLRVGQVVDWFRIGEHAFGVGVLLDPLSAGMGAMVAFVALWIFLYSTGYMAEESRYRTFFGYLSLFCGAMLLVVYANSLLLLFMAWEIVGLASYLLIGYYYEKPEAAKAAQKAFITTRVGDVAFFFGMVWLFTRSGTLLFYDNGRGLLESGALASLAGATTVGGLTVSAAAALFLLVGAMGKSGQVPLHVWLPDAMEGPTPVSALIHAATMVAAGIYLVARCFPIFEAGANPVALDVAAWVGAVTALVAAVVAVAQCDFKRILAYSTVSQLGFMMVALGTGGMAAGMLHLICHAFFKALLFLSAGSVIHGCHGLQDIRKMGGLARPMRATFAVYAVGMLALAGFPFLFSGFWSKEAVLHSAVGWHGGKGPFILLVLAAVLTGFYMTRQLCLVFFGEPRGDAAKHAHESPLILVGPMAVLAAGAVLLSLVATPFWPWYEKWLVGEPAAFDGAAFSHHGVLPLLLTSLGIVTVGVGAGWLLYRRGVAGDALLSGRFGKLWGAMENAMGFDAFYAKWVIAPLAFIADGVRVFERGLMGGMLAAGERVFKTAGSFAKGMDERGWNVMFDKVCGGMKARAANASRNLPGTPQAYLYGIGLGMVVLMLVHWVLTRWS